MDGHSAKKAPVLDHLVGTSSAPTGNNSTPAPRQPSQAKPVLATTSDSNAAAAKKNSAFRDSNGKPLSNAIVQPGNPNQQKGNPQIEKLPQNRRTDKSEFELELARTVNKIMLKHFEHASEEIVSQVLSEVRARLPGRRKS